jgi:hypothetical protein
MSLLTTEKFQPSAASAKEQAEISAAAMKRTENHALMNQILPIPETRFAWWRRHLSTDKVPLPLPVDPEPGHNQTPNRAVTAWLERDRRDPDGRIDFMLQATQAGRLASDPQAKLGLDEAGTLYDYGEEFTGFTPSQHGELMDSLRAALIVLKHEARQPATWQSPTSETTAHHFLGRVFSS